MSNGTFPSDPYDYGDGKWMQPAKPTDDDLLAEVNRLQGELAAIRKAAREYLAASVPECAETGAELGRESWTPGFRAKFEALEQLAKEPTR